MERLLRLIMNIKETPERTDLEYDYHNVPTLPADELHANREQARADEEMGAGAVQIDAGEVEDQAVPNPVDVLTSISSSDSGESESTDDPTATIEEIPVVIVGERQPPSPHTNFDFARAFYFRMLRRADDTSDQGSDEVTAMGRRTCIIEMYVVSTFILLLVVFCMVLKIYLMMRGVSNSTSNDTACTMAGFAMNNSTWMDDLEDGNTTLAINGTLNVTTGTTSMDDILNITSTDSDVN